MRRKTSHAKKLRMKKKVKNKRHTSPRSSPRCSFVAHPIHPSPSSSTLALSSLVGAINKIYLASGVAIVVQGFRVI